MNTLTIPKILFTQTFVALLMITFMAVGTAVGVNALSVDLQVVGVIAIAVLVTISTSAISSWGFVVGIAVTTVATFFFAIIMVGTEQDDDLKSNAVLLATVLSFLISHIKLKTADTKPYSDILCMVFFIFFTLVAIATYFHSTEPPVTLLALGTLVFGTLGVGLLDFLHSKRGNSLFMERVEANVLRQVDKVGTG